MLRSALASRKNIKKPGNRETGLWDTARADARHLGGNDVPSLGSSPATMIVTAFQVLYGENAFKPPVLPYCIGDQTKQEGAQLIQIQVVVRLLKVVITSTMVVLTSVRQVTACSH